MSNYQEVVYGNYPASDYPSKLARHLANKYMTNKEGDLLELGCGDGSMCKALYPYFSSVNGLDAQTKCTTYVAGKNLQRLDVIKKDWAYMPDFINFELDFLPFQDTTFDYVFSKSTIEHLRNTDHFLTEIHRVLKYGGKAVILCPAWEYNYRDFYNDYTHVKPFHRKGLQDALRINNFSHVKVEYFYHLPFIWKQPYLWPIPKFLSLFNRFKWTDKEQTKHNVLLRFSQEVQLLAVAEKT